MEHITIKDLKNGYFKLIPDNWYMLYNTVTMQTYSEAIVKESNIKYFRIAPSSVVNPLISTINKESEVKEETDIKKESDEKSISEEDKSEESEDKEIESETKD